MNRNDAQSVRLAASLSRRNFLKGIAAAGVAPAVIPSGAFGRAGRASAANRITLGIIGVGGMGTSNMRSFLRLPDAQVVAVCDVDREHYRDNEWGKGRPFGREPAKAAVEKHYADAKRSDSFQGCAAYEDYRELCARKDIDAVVVATPDHWHALCALEVVRSGKDVYCEKPVTHWFREGQLLYREVARRQAVFQTGSQQRSTANFRHAVEVVLNGHIGRVREVEVGLPSGYDEPQAPAKIEEPPEHLDYDFWCGPSEVLPYMRARHHRLWRGRLEYGGGNLMDWIGHHNDIAHWGIGMDRGGPNEVEAVGWTWPKTEIYNAPVEYEVRSRYRGGITVTISTKFEMGTKWIGEDGWVYVNRGKSAASDPRWVEKDFNPGSHKAYFSPEHHRNFIDCVKTRKECVTPAETAHRSITPGHLAYVSDRVGRKLKWDPQRERILGDPEAQALLKVNYRKPWKLA